MHGVFKKNYLIFKLTTVQIVYSMAYRFLTKHDLDKLLYVLCLVTIFQCPTGFRRIRLADNTVFSYFCLTVVVTCTINEAERYINKNSYK